MEDHPSTISAEPPSVESQRKHSLWLEPNTQTYHGHSDSYRIVMQLETSNISNTQAFNCSV